MQAIARRAGMLRVWCWGAAAFVMAAATAMALQSAPRAAEAPTWTAQDVALLRSLSIDALPPAPADSSNAYQTDPVAVQLGSRLFTDPRLSRDGRTACVSCHQPALAYTDGRKLAKGVAPGLRNTPTLEGVAFGRSFNWDGRSDTLWAQALGVVESSAEMGSTRSEVASLLQDDPELRSLYEQAFGPISFVAPDQPCGPAMAGPVQSAQQACWELLPSDKQIAINRRFVNAGKALAAFVGTLRPQASRFDLFVRELTVSSQPVASTLLSASEQRGLRLFISPERTACLNCHNGPLLSNGGFHDIGTGGGTESAPELGRMLGARLLGQSEFRCDGPYSDSMPSQCEHARFQHTSQSHESPGAFKVPTLRNVGNTAPYMHNGSFANLGNVISHYRSPPSSGATGVHELKALDLSDQDAIDLMAFLQTLTSAPSRSTHQP